MADIIEYITDSLDVAHERGDELILRECLFCGKPLKMYVNVAKLKFNCFSGGCGARGRLVALVMAIEDCDLIEASRLIKEMGEGLIRSKPLSALERAYIGLTQPAAADGDGLLEVPLPAEYQPCWDGSNWSVPQYLSDRGVNKASLQKWRVGFCSNGRYAGRVIIPVACRGMSSFVARDVTGRARQKYLNPGAALMGQMLFGYDTLRSGATVVAVEGVFDAIRLQQHGLPAVAYFGAEPRDGQTRLLERLEPRRVILLPDPDAYQPALDYAVSVIGRFKEVRVARLGRGDPADAPWDEVQEALWQSEAITSQLDALALNLF